MKELLLTLTFVAALAGCNSSTTTPAGARTSVDQTAVEAQAVTKLGCAIENKARCTHLIENRLLFNRFFQPQVVSGMTDTEVAKGRRVTTKFVAEAVSSINQCVPVSAESIVVINNIVLAGKPYAVRGTSPLEPATSSCFLSQVEEAS